MAAGLKNVKDHIKAVANIEKITNSMKVVSATKFLQAEKNLVVARPFGLGAMHFYDLNPLALDLSAIRSHLCPITSDRGLCGAMTSTVCKHTRKQIGVGEQFRLICLGEKCRLHFAFDLKELISLVINGISLRTPKFLDASLIAEYILSDIDFIFGRIIYCRFINVIHFEVKELPVYSMPIMVAAKELNSYENEDEIIHNYMEFSVAALFFYALSENYMVELASRMNAMSKAAKNATQVNKTLKLKYNRVRQSVITRELIDIVSGAQVITGR